MHCLTPNSKIPYAKIDIKVPNDAAIPPKGEKKLDLTKIGNLTPQEFDNASKKNQLLKPIYNIFFGMTSLHFAAEAGNVSLVKHLIKVHKADVNVGSSMTGSALFSAIKCKDEEKRLLTINALLKKNADINIGKISIAYYGGTASPSTNLEQVTVLREATAIDLKLTIYLISNGAVAHPPYESDKAIKKSNKKGFEVTTPGKEMFQKRTLLKAHQIFEKGMLCLQLLPNALNIPREVFLKIVKTAIDLHVLDWQLNSKKN